MRKEYKIHFSGFFSIFFNWAIQQNQQTNLNFNDIRHTENILNDDVILGWEHRITRRWSKIDDRNSRNKNYALTLRLICRILIGSCRFQGMSSTNVFGFPNFELCFRWLQSTWIAFLSAKESQYRLKLTQGRADFTDIFVVEQKTIKCAKCKPNSKNSTRQLRGV